MKDDTDKKTSDTVVPFGPPHPRDKHKMKDKKPKREPILNIPPVTRWLLLINLAIFFARFLMPEALYETYMLAFSFIPKRFGELGVANVFSALSPITYMFFHGNGLHITMNAAMLMGVGSGVEQALGKKRFIIFYLLCGVLAVLGHFVLYSHTITPLVGASGAVSGLFGGVLLLMQRQRRFAPGIKGVLPVILVWTLVNIGLGIMGMPGEPNISVAWVAHLVGFYAGLGLFPLFLKRI
jgi:membrane associated rhomboid family serine protease